jgi:CHAT domain-containing protein
VRSINLGIIVTHQPTTKLTIELPVADATATAGITSSSSKPFELIPLSGGDTRFTRDLPPGHYALTIDSTIRPGESGVFRVTTDQDATFWSVAKPDPGIDPRPWGFGTGRTVESGNPKNPWPDPPVQASFPVIINSLIRDVMSDLLDANAGRGSDPAQVAPRTYALLIGIDRYPPGPGQGSATYTDLRGCVTDVLEIERVLRARVAKLCVVRLLSPRPDGPGHNLEILPGEPGDDLAMLLSRTSDGPGHDLEVRAEDVPTYAPTYANIVAAWQCIAAVATENDLFYIHYSGHGGRVKTSFPDIKTTGVDESIVPFDINDRDKGRYLRDFEIASLLQQLAERGIKTTLVLDSCHSGSFTRGDQVQVRTREDGLPDLEPRGSEELGSGVGSTTEELRLVATRLEIGLRDATWKVQPDGRLSSPVTVIAACRATEGAYEYSPDGGPRCGALSYFWRRALAQWRPDLTYRKAFAKVFNSVHSVFSQQSPVLLGEPNRVVLDTNVLVEGPTVRVTEVSEAQIALDAGASTMVAPGMRFAIVPPGQAPEHEDLAKRVHVEVASVTDSSAVATRAVGTGGDAAIEIGARAIVRSYAPRVQRAVRVIAPWPFGEALAAAIAADPTKLLAVAGASGGDYQVIVDPLTLEAEITDLNGTPLPFVPRIPIGLVDAIATIVQRLVHIARYNNVHAFSNDDPSGALANKVTIELLDLPGFDPATPMKRDPQPVAPGTLFVEDGKFFLARITNTSRHALLVDILNMRPDWSIVRLTANSRELEGGGTLEFPMRASLIDPTWSPARDVLKVLATADMLDASLLTLSVLGAPPLERGPRGPEDPPLQELFRILQDPLVEQRNADLVNVPSSRWTIETAEFVTTRVAPLTDAERGAAVEKLAHPGVRDALGGSLAVDELRGNFAEARKAAENASGFEPILLDAITGRTGAARRRLIALSVPNSDAGARIVQRRLAILIDTLHFMQVPGAIGAHFDDLVGRWDRSGGLQPRDEVLGLAGVASAHELRALDAIGGMLNARYVMAASARTVAPEGEFAERLAARLKTARAVLAAFARSVDGVMPQPCSTTWMALADADLVRRAGDTATALQQIRDERARCETAGDGHGAGLCWLAEGDLRACIIESPATLGLWIEGSSSGIDSAAGPLGEALEQERVTDAELAAAREAFMMARQRFAETGAARAMASTDLRLAGVAALAGDYGTAHEIAGSAESQFVAAGDDCQRWLARVHCMLADVARKVTVAPAGIDHIAKWGTGDGDLAYALGLGCLVARAGRRWLIRDAGYEQAVRCAKVAEHLFRAAGATLVAAQALGDQVTAHQAIHDRGAAIAAAQRADELLASLGPRVTPGLSIAQRRVLFQLRAWSLASAARDAGGMEAFAARLRSTAHELGPDPSSGGLALLVEQALQDTTALAPGYRAMALELDPEASTAVRDAAWQVADQAVQTLPEPKRWFYDAFVHAGRDDRAGAAALFARYFDADPTGAQSLPLDATPELIRQAQAQQADLAFAAFVRVRDGARARTHLETLRALGGDAWWKLSGDPWKTLAHFGDLQLMEGNPAGALDSYAQARDLVEQRGAMLVDDSSKTAFADSPNAQRLFAHATQAALILRAPDLAFDFLERGRARALADLIADVRTAAAGRDPIAQWRMASARRDTVRAQIAQLAADSQYPNKLDQLQETLKACEQKVSDLADVARAVSPERFHALDTRAAVAPLSQVIERIPSGVLVIELSVVDSFLVGWSLTKAGMKTQLCREIDDYVVRRDALRFQRACASPGRSLAAGEGLAADLLVPFAAEIRAASQVVFVVSGELARVPFHALPFDGDALIARVAVSYAPSASLLGRLHAEPVKDVPVLIVGDPPSMELRDPDGLAEPRPLRPLPGARREAREIAQLVPGSRLLIEDATVANVNAALPGFRVVHFATHGIVDPESPWQSAIMLANGEQLSVSDLMGVALAADLVVLSACSSGLGELTRGEEVIGLARGLLAAGARAVIVSLWNVYDGPTRVLMVELYRQLQSGARPAEALRAAQRYVRQLDVAPSTPAFAGETSETSDPNLRRNATIVGEPEPLQGFAHPVSWAPFLLMGV